MPSTIWNVKPLTVVVDTTSDLRPGARTLEWRWRRVQFIEHNIIIIQDDVALRNNIQQEYVFLSTLQHKSMVRRGESTNALRLYTYDGKKTRKKRERNPSMMSMQGVCVVIWKSCECMCYEYVSEWIRCKNEWNIFKPYVAATFDGAACLLDLLGLVSTWRYTW